MSNLENNLKIVHYLIQFAEDLYNPEFLENLKKIA